MIRPAAAAFLLLSAVGGAAAGSAECAKTSTAPVKFICEDATLEALDKEAARLAGLAGAGAHLTPARRKELSQSQAAFRKTLGACKDAKRCLERTLVEHIHRLRQGYAATRTKDAEGISLGPFVAACPGLDALIGVSFVNSAPAFVWLEWRDRSILLQQAVAASGARYTGALGTGEAQFWNKGKEATLDLPGKATLTCEMQEPG
jgi:hypothetical protein